jgi:hypothetical protein
VVDKIDCFNKKQHEEMAKVSSGFVEIEGQRIDDYRDALRQKHLNPSRTSNRHLHETTLMDLEKWKVGYPYLYRHLYKITEEEFECDHLFVISDLKLFNRREDCFDLE